MSKDKNKFDLYVWAALLKFINDTGEIPTMPYIIKTFGTSNRLANAYRFALINRFEINSDPGLSKQLGRAKNTARELRRISAKLTVDNEILEAKVDFLMALEQMSKDIKPMTITKSIPSEDETTAIALYSDAHVEERVDILVVNGLNEYNPDIAKMRVNFYFRRLLWMIDSWRRGGWKIDKLVLAILGDTITGYIHEELMEGNFMSPTEAVGFSQELLIEGIQYLADVGRFKEITVVCKFGNHGRISKRKKFSTGYKNSYEYMMYTQIQKIFRDHKTGYNHINFVIEKGEFTTIPVYDKVLCFSHGDHFNYQGGIGGILIPFNRWIHKMDPVLGADKYYVSHWHGYNSIKRGVMNGSIIGYSPFAIGHAFEPEPPQQHLELIDSKRGFSLNAPIILEDWQ